MEKRKREEEKCKYSLSPSSILPFLLDLIQQVSQKLIPEKSLPIGRNSRIILRDAVSSNGFAMKSEPSQCW
jgi:hypothetical protein